MAAAAPSRQRLRAWCFTLNFGQAHEDGSYEYDDARFSAIERLRAPESRVKGFVYQVEKGSSGNIHYQGYCTMTAAVDLNVMRTILPGAHFEGRRGTHKQACDYCMKTESRYHPDGAPWMEDPILFPEEFCTEQGRRVHFVVEDDAGIWNIDINVFDFHDF